MSVKLAGNEMLELTGLVKDVAATMETDRREIDKQLKALETWNVEIEQKLSKGLRQAHLTPASGPGSDHLKEAAGLWFAGALLRKPELISQGEKALGIQQRAGLDESNDTEGGYLVPQQLAAEVLRLAAAIAAVRPLARVLPMASKTLDLPDLQTEPAVSIVAEEAAIPVSEPAFGQKTMNARKIAAIAKMSLEVSQDSIVGLGAFLLQLFAEKIAGLEDQQACEGNGVGGNFMGLFTVAGTGAVSVAGALTNVDPFITALRETLPMVAQPNATWVMHPKLWGRIQKLKDSQNQYLLNPAPTGDIPMSLLGRPVKLTDQISVTRGSGNDTTAYVGDFARGMLFGDRMRMELGINPFVDWGTAQISVRVIERVGILVGIPRAFVKLTGITVA